MLKSLSKFSWLIAIFVSLIFVSCKDSEIAPLIEDNVTSNEDWQIQNNLAKSIARNLSKQTDNKALMRFIKENSLERFDGDDNFLIINKIHEELSDKSSRKFNFGDLISLHENNPNSKTSNSLLDSIREFAPLIQVSMYVPENEKLESWDIDETTLVGFVPQSENLKYIPAFDQDGNAYELSIEDAPKNTMILISQNERVIRISSDESSSEQRTLRCEYLNELNTVYSDEESNYYLKSDYYNALALCPIDGGGGGTGGGSTGGGSGSSGCDRDNKNAKDNLLKFKFDTDKAYKDAKDGWFNNDLEIRVDILFANKNGAVPKVTKYFDKRQSDVKNLQWTSAGVEIIAWDKTVWGDSFLYSWLEDDGGGTTKITTNWTTKFDDNNTVTSNYSYDIPANHYEMGSSVVQYCDNTDGEGYTYSTGRVSFKVNQ